MRMALSLEAIHLLATVLLASKTATLAYSFHEESIPLLQIVPISRKLGSNKVLLIKY